MLAIRQGCLAACRQAAVLGWLHEHCNGADRGTHGRLTCSKQPQVAQTCLAEHLSPSACRSTSRGSSKSPLAMSSSEATTVGSLYLSACRASSCLLLHGCVRPPSTNMLLQCSISALPDNLGTSWRPTSSRHCHELLITASICSWQDAALESHTSLPFMYSHP